MLRRLPDLDKLTDLVSDMAVEASAVRNSVSAVTPPPGTDDSKRAQALERMNALRRKIDEAGRLLGSDKD